MTIATFLANAGLIAALMVLLALAELALPLFPRARGSARVRVNLALSGLTLLLNWGLITLAALAVARYARTEQSLPTPSMMIATVLALDLATYFAHRSMHALPWLWRAHQVHHSDSFVDVTTTLRQHPLEGLWRFAWIAVPTALFGLPAAGVLAYRLTSVVQGLFEHANLRVWPPFDRGVSLVWVTPNMHKVHHSRLRAETDSNYGNLLSLFDRAFGTFASSARSFPIEYGLDQVAPGSMASLVAVACPDGDRAGGAAHLGRRE